MGATDGLVSGFYQDHSEARSLVVTVGLGGESLGETGAKQLSPPAAGVARPGQGGLGLWGLRGTCWPRSHMLAAPPQSGTVQRWRCVTQAQRRIIRTGGANPFFLGPLLVKHVLVFRRERRSSVVFRFARGQHQLFTLWRFFDHVGTAPGFCSLAVAPGGTFRTATRLARAAFILPQGQGCQVVLRSVGTGNGGLERDAVAAPLLALCHAG